MSYGTIIKELKNNEETSNAGKKWTSDEDELLVEEIKEKIAYKEIALNHKRTISSIKIRVISHIIYPKYHLNIESNIEKISVEYNLDNELIIKYINRLKSVETKQKSVKVDEKQLFEFLQNLENKMNEINTKLNKLLNL